MNQFRAWFTPGSVVAAMIVALLWLHRLHLSAAGHEAAQILLVCITYGALWVLTRGDDGGE